MAYDHTHKHADRYHGAVAGRIRANAAKSRRLLWIESNDDAQEIIDFLAANIGIGFLGAMNASLDEWGGLTDNQTGAVRKIMAQNAERAAMWAAEDASSAHVGIVGERQAFELTVKHVVDLDGMYGTLFINICHDVDKNVVVYKGAQCWGSKGATVTCMAKIKEHGNRDGVKQTIIQRPTKTKVGGKDY
ncbi:MAG: hypothetical protein CMJ25_28205 [Phycisphaerae bacterium]|nr:hypothetical protein [Phycisphaerae bacterium]|tara:strand:+ start:9135 stop:9701 length:567 start_codon:yes stop_codon:yes gene_type:complete